MNTTTPPPAGNTNPATDTFFDRIRSTGVVRTEDRWVGGVAAGIARRAGLDPLVGRALMFLAVFLGGLGLVIYGIGWALLPEERDQRIHAQQLLRGNVDAAAIAAIVMTLIGLSGWWGPWGDLYPWSALAGLTALVVVLALVMSTQHDPGRTATAPTTTSAAATAPAAVPIAAGAPAPAGSALPSPGRTSPARSSAGTAVVLGLGMLTLAGLWLAARNGTWDGPVLFTAASATVLLAGLGIVIAGIGGRSAGGLTAVALVTALVVVPATAVTTVGWERGGTVAAAGELHRAPQTATEAEQGFVVGAGEAEIDLTGLDLGTATAPVRVPISVGAGEANVLVPAAEAYTATVDIFAGDVRWDGRELPGSVLQHYSLESDPVRDGADPRLHLDIRVGAGDVTITEETP